MNSRLPSCLWPLMPRNVLFLLMALMLTPSANAQPAQTPATYSILHETVRSHRIERFVAEAEDGARYQIFRALPRSAAPAKGYPVLTMLDGNAVFDRLTPDMLARVPGLVLIGIGYDTALRFDSKRRSLDYTPPLSPDGPVADPERPGGQVGGADRFLRRLTGKLRMAAEAGVAVDPDRRTLWGHSYGGLFALYTLLTEPDAFSRYAAISPSVDWGEGALGKWEAAAALPGNMRREVLIAYGDSERRGRRGPDGQAIPTPKTPNPEGMRSKNAFAERLRNRTGIMVDERVLEGLGHGETLPASFPLAFRLALR